LIYVQYLEDLQLKVKELYNIVCELEEEKYDWEMKTTKQEFEVCSSSRVALEFSFNSSAK